MKNSIDEEKILNDLESVSRDFGFDYNEEWFSYSILPAEDLLILTFLMDSPKPSYNKFGRGPERAENVGEFIGSDVFEEDIELYRKRGGGTTLHERYFGKYEKYVDKIPDSDVKDRVETIFHGVGENFDQNSLAVICEGERSQIILEHEWIHALLEENNIVFQDVGKDWEWDEGLVTYLQYYISDSLSTLKEGKDKYNDDFYSKYGEYARKWIEILKNANSPQERREGIMNKLEE